MKTLSLEDKKAVKEYQLIIDSLTLRMTIHNFVDHMRKIGIYQNKIRAIEGPTEPCREIDYGVRIIPLTKAS